MGKELNTVLLYKFYSIIIKQDIVFKSQKLIFIPVTENNSCNHTLFIHYFNFFHFI